MPQRNLAVELLRKLLAGEIKTRGRRNVVQARSFAELLEQALRRYQNRAIETAQVIEELIALAKEMREASSPRRGARPHRRRARLLRRARDQRQRGQGARRAETLLAIARELTEHGPDQRHDRLDRPRERPRPAPRPRQADPPQARLPARQAGEGDADRARAGRGAVGAVGGGVRRQSRELGSENPGRFEQGCGDGPRVDVRAYSQRRGAHISTMAGRGRPQRVPGGIATVHCWSLEERGRAVRLEDARFALDAGDTVHRPAAPAPVVSVGSAGGQRRPKSLTAEPIDR